MIILFLFCISTTSPCMGCAKIALQFSAPFSPPLNTSSHTLFSRLLPSKTPCTNLVIDGAHVIRLLISHPDSTCLFQPFHYPQDISHYLQPWAMIWHTHMLGRCHKSWNDICACPVHLQLADGHHQAILCTSTTHALNSNDRLDASHQRFHSFAYWYYSSIALSSMDREI